MALENDLVVLNSNKITVFPTANRISNDYYRSARLLSEGNLSSIILQVLDVDSFVISETLSTSENLEFDIHGYYFNIDFQHLLQTLDITPTDGVKIVATIDINSDGMLRGADITDSSGVQNYDGIHFYYTLSSTVPSIVINQNSTTHNLIIAVYNGSWKLPENSRVKFNNSSFKVDGGEI